MYPKTKRRQLIEEVLWWCIEHKNTECADHGDEPEWANQFEIYQKERADHEQR